jgi:hypothetical protein
MAMSVWLTIILQFFVLGAIEIDPIALDTMFISIASNQEDDFFNDYCAKFFVLWHFFYFHCGHTISLLVIFVISYKP